MLISKSITPQPGKQKIARQIFPNISRSTGNETMKLSPVIEHNIRSIFLKKEYTKCGGETISRINTLKFYRVCFY